MNPDQIRAALEGHEPYGDYGGEVIDCECGWDGTVVYGGYLDHIVDVITGVKDDHGDPS